jgi:hypothetical protein
MSKVQLKINPSKITQNFPKRKITTGLLNCGDCVGLSTEILIEGSTAPCKDQGMDAVNRACPKFKPDVFSLVTMEGDGIMDMMDFVRQIMRNFPANKFKLLGSLFFQESDTRKHGYSFGQRVYVRYRGTKNSNYLSNFMSCYVLSANENEVKLFSVDPRERRFTLTYDNTGLQGPSIYSGRNFKILKDDMLNKKRTVDPDHERNTSKSLISLEEFDLANMSTGSLDGFVVSMSDVMKKNGKKPKSKSRFYDLTDFAEDVVGGNMVKGQSYKTKSKSKKSKSGSIELSELL